MSISDYDRQQYNLQIQQNGDFTATRYLLEKSTDLIVANPGGGAASAVQLTGQMARIGTVATTSDSVKLPPAVAGLGFTLINHGANPAQVFTSGTDVINDVAAATGVSQMQLSTVFYSCITAGQWYTEGLANGFANGLPTSSSTPAITATPAGTQASSVQLTSVINRITVVATIGDGVKLPPALTGTTLIVANTAANAANVFPNTGDAINALAANAAFSLAGGKTASLYCAAPGFWHSVLSA